MQPPWAQQSASAVVAEPEAPRVVLQAETTASVLRLMKFSGLLRDHAGNARTGAVGLTFALYKDQQDGSPLWIEVQNAQLDEQGRYTVLLGSTKNEGLPLELFSSGEARWLGVQVNLPGEEEQARVLLVSVPYALKAADAETLGGKPPSAFLLAEKAEEREKAEAKPEAGKEAAKEGPPRDGVVGPINGEGTAGFVAKFTGANNIGNGTIFDNGNVGIGTTSPSARLHIFEPEPSQNANVRLMGSGQTGSWMDIFSGTAVGHGLFGYGNQPFIFGAGGQERMRITPTGNVGLGTTSPNAKLSVGPGSLPDGNVPVQISTGASGTVGYYGANKNGGYGLLLGYENGGFLGTGGVLRMVSSDPLLFFVNNTTEAMRITSTGNLGIGTAAPSQKLEVAGSVKLTGGGNGIMFPDGSLQTTAAAGSAATINPQQVALLRWYNANQTASFAVGTAPDGLAFDGANIWVTGRGIGIDAADFVTKLRASDGTNLGSFEVANGPVRIAFDGANIWVAHLGGVTKLRASDGATLGTFWVGSGPIDVAFDGANIWVARSDSNNVAKLRASDGANLGTFAVGSAPRSMAFDGTNIWVANQLSNSVTKLRASDGANLGTFAVGLFPNGVAFDGANIWVVNGSSNNVTKLRASDGATLGTFAVGAGPSGVAFDGANIWVVNGNVTKLRASDGANLGTFAVGSGPGSVAFDGANIWVACSGTVSKL